MLQWEQCSRIEEQEHADSPRLGLRGDSVGAEDKIGEQVSESSYFLIKEETKM